MIESYTLRSARADDAERCYAIERSAYEGDEAATLEKISRRINDYPQGFLVCEVEGEIAGFINCGCADKVDMADEAFKALIGHDPQGAHAVVLSLVVDPQWQGRGIASILMLNFVLRMKRLGKQGIQLMCREQHVALYEHLGFRYDQPSNSLHGGLRWHEMSRSLLD